MEGTRRRRRSVKNARKFPRNVAAGQGGGLSCRLGSYANGIMVKLDSPLPLLSLPVRGEMLQDRHCRPTDPSSLTRRDQSRVRRLERNVSSRVRNKKEKEKPVDGLFLFLPPLSPFLPLHTSGITDIFEFALSEFARPFGARSNYLPARFPRDRSSMNADHVAIVPRTTRGGLH